MKRLIIFCAAFVAAPTMAQTTLDITVPGTGNPVCSYITGPVTNGATPGHLQATATSSSGAGCGTGSSGNVTFGPASSLSPQSTTVASGGSVSYSFEVLNATSCTAAITGAASGSFTGGSTLCSGTGSSTCSNRLVPASASFTNSGSTAVTDTVTLTCTGTSGQAQSVATVQVNGQGQGGGGGSCSVVVPGDPSGGVSSYTNQGTTTVRIGGDQHNQTSDMTNYVSVFGGFPGNPNTAYDSLPINNYISMAFTPPAGFYANAPIGWYLDYSVGTSFDDTKVSMTISTSCGDFRPTTGTSTVVKNCYKVGVIAQGFLQTFAQGDPLSQCVLTDGQTYYWNIINANISGLTATGGSAKSYKDGPGSQCTGKSACSVPLQNGPMITYPGYP